MKLKEYIAIAADIATIVGVSIASILGPKILSELFGHRFSFFSFFSAILFYAIILNTIAFILITFACRIREQLSMQAYRKLSLSIIAALLLVTVSSAAFPRLRDTYANLTGTQYLYPDAPIAIAEGIECKKIAPGSIGGAIKHAATAEIDYNNYRVLLYAKYSRSSFYELQERYVAEASGTYVQNTSTSLDKSGSFIIPGLKLYKDNEQNYLEGTIVALITNLDDGIVKRYPFSIIKSNDAALSMIRSIAGDCTAS